MASFILLQRVLALLDSSNSLGLPGSGGCRWVRQDGVTTRILTLSFPLFLSLLERDSLVLISPTTHYNYYYASRPTPEAVVDQRSEGMERMHFATLFIDHRSGYCLHTARPRLLI